jgi:hypothetical protein
VDTLCLLDKYIGRVGAIFREQGVYIASSNYAAIFEYGQPDVTIPPMFDQKTIQSIKPLERHKSARQFWESSSGSISCPDPYIATGSISEETAFTESAQILSYASHLAFSTLAIILEQLGDKNVLPHVHISLSFLWCLALNPKSMIYVEAEVPWARAAAFLNTLIRHDTDIVGTYHFFVVRNVPLSCESEDSIFGTRLTNPRTKTFSVGGLELPIKDGYLFM